MLVLHSALFDFVTDDAFISFVYAKNLALHGQLVFNLGERVEGYTNFAWTVLLAGGIRCGLGPERLSVVLGTLCALGSMVYSANFFRRMRSDFFAPSLPAWILALVPGFACWAQGGLETQLFTLLCLLAIGEYVLALVAESSGHGPGFLWPGVAVGLAALTRPEGHLLFAVLVLHRLFDKARRRAFLPTRQDLVFVAVFLAFTLPHIAWRRHYYGYFVPNTFYVKSSGGKGTWAQGGYYLFAFLRDLKLWVLLALYGLGFLRPPPEPHVGYWLVGEVMLFWSLPFVLYVASVGGDFMGLYRFVMPLGPLWVWCGVLGVDRLQHGLKILRHGVWLLLLLHGMNTVFVDRHALTFIGADRGIDTPGFLRHYTNDRIAIGKWLGQVVKPDDYQVVGGAGAQVYYAGIRALDSYGLSDAYVAHRVAARSIRPGHQKFAPLEYVLSVKPTILTYNVYRIGHQPYQPTPQEEAMWKSRGFHYVSAQIPGLSQPYYSFLKRIDRELGPFGRLAPSR